MGIQVTRRESAAKCDATEPQLQHMLTSASFYWTDYACQYIFIEYCDL